jgi:hypothetical protein
MRRLVEKLWVELPPVVRVPEIADVPTILTTDLIGI